MDKTIKDSIGHIITLKYFNFTFIILNGERQSTNLTLFYDIFFVSYENLVLCLSVKRRQPYIQGERLC